MTNREEIVTGCYCYPCAACEAAENDEHVEDCRCDDPQDIDCDTCGTDVSDNYHVITGYPAEALSNLESYLEENWTAPLMVANAWQKDGTMIVIQEEGIVVMGDKDMAMEALWDADITDEEEVAEEQVCGYCPECTDAQECWETCMECWDKDGELQARIEVEPAIYKRMSYLLKYGTSDFSGFAFYPKDADGFERWKAFGGPRIRVKRNGKKPVELIGPDYMFEELLGRIAMQDRLSK